MGEKKPRTGKPPTTGPSAGTEREGNERDEATLFPIVGIGASAGGLEAFRQLLASLPIDTGMAFVMISHLDPEHKSLLTEILARSTQMKAVEVSDGLPVAPDRVYVIPPNRSMTISRGTLKLLPRSKLREPHHPIDHFLRSLAEDRSDRAIGVILSGLDGDGTLGLEAIKAKGGITFAQDESATYDSMPTKAIAAGVVDFVLPPAEIANEIARIARHPYVASSGVAPGGGLASENGTGFEKILATLSRGTGVDFTQYKPNTLERRIGRRMVLHRIDRMEQYAEHLRSAPAEVEALYQDVLIGVTSFFRDPAAFETLKEIVISELVTARAPDEPIRVWVLGCSTGEEAYSIAMILSEVIGDSATHIPVQIYATDLNEMGIEKARSGVYGKTIARDVSPERLRRFFVEAEGGYRISKPLRNMCVFARYNVLADPPFSRMDLVSCRNLLIYLRQSAQKTIVPTLHYALKPGGFLMLGASEAVTAFQDLFAPADKRHKIYSKKLGSARSRFHLPRSPAGEHSTFETEVAARVEGAESGFDAQREADRIVLARYASAGVLVNDDFDILQFRGSTGPYLEPAPGKATHSVLKMARPGLFAPLRTALQKAKKDGVPTRREGVRVTAGDRSVEIALEVVPIAAPSPAERCFLIVFEPAVPRLAPHALVDAALERRAVLDRRVAELEQELAATREYTQSVVEQHDTANEKLQAASEEMQSSNEELQSINEELETTKEELQSSNEELTTVNEELQNRNQELSAFNIDLVQVQAERAQAFDEAEAARKTAQVANRTKDIFLATVSHELRTPLNSILGWAHILRSGPADESIVIRGVETIERNAKMQAHIIDDLMDIARIISGKLHIEPTLVDLASVVLAAVEEVRPTANTKGISLETVLAPAAILALVDADRLRQIVWNLTTNAINCTPKGGRVEVRVERAGDTATLTVSDTGRGIDAGVLPHIFDQFQQADTSATRMQRGLGLGLAIVRSLVDLHGGSVRAESRGEGRGAVFIVTLPVAKEIGENKSSEPPLVDTPSIAGVRLLVVDDDEDARDMLALGLAHYGAETRTCSSAAEALGEVERWCPHVLVSDLGMPGEDGFALMKKVRALGNERGGSLVAVALTGFVTAGDQQNALAAGFDLHRPKPVDLQALAASIASLLANDRPLVRGKRIISKTLERK